MYWYVLQLQPLCHKYAAVCCNCSTVSTSIHITYYPILRSFMISKIHANLSKETIFAQYAAVDIICCNCAAAWQQCVATWFFFVLWTHFINLSYKNSIPSKKISSLCMKVLICAAAAIIMPQVCSSMLQPQHSIH